MQNQKENAFSVLEKAKTYLKCLKYDGASIMQSFRYTCFLGFCVCIDSAKGLFNDLILPDDEPMKYLPHHKISQDQLDFFFSNLRSHRDRNDNPTVRLFESIYKKMLVYLELMDAESRNCLPLEQITILHCSSTFPVDRINLTTARQNSDRHDIDASSSDEQLDGSCILTLSTLGEKVVEYIAG